MRTSCCLLACLVVASVAFAADEVEAPVERATVLVGQTEGDFRGRDQRVLQAAIDYVANLGGGTVRIGPGRYLLRSSVTLRDGVRLVGTRGKTVLTPVDGVRSALAEDGDANQR